MIGDDDVVLGFDLVGVRGRVATNPREAEEALGHALANEEVGIVLITERVAELIRPQVDKHVLGESFPLVVEIPDRHGPIEGKPSLREMMNAAMGVNL
ncbi:MAG: V-type ATP synthase subunit F [Planctomycetota bacterium]